MNTFYRIYEYMNIIADRMRPSTAEAEALLKALANRHRMAILYRLIDAECSVGELAAHMSLRASTVSQHLALLRKDGIVAARRDGQTVWYAIASGQARQVLETLYSLYAAPSARPQPKRRRKTRTN